MFDPDLHPEVPDDPAAAAAVAEYSIRAVHRVCDLLDLLQGDDGGTSLARAASASGLPKSSVFRYLATLEGRHYVERDDNGDYRIGLALLPMQARQLDLMTRRVRPILTRLQQELDETVSLGMLDGNTVVYLDVLESSRAMRLASRVGAREALHAGAMGKVLASRLELTDVRTILESQGMPRLTPHTIVTIKDYVDHLEIVREEGFALDESESELGGRAVAVAVEDVHLPLALSLSGPEARLEIDAIPEIVDVLHDTADLVADELLDVVE
ncbi:MAG: IclR family transcriptional regulator [Patulibacter sp.]|nr:IclR family transcriptional regulator [Patulibacter sp.]